MKEDIIIRLISKHILTQFHRRSSPSEAFLSILGELTKLKIQLGISDSLRKDDDSFHKLLMKMIRRRYKRLIENLDQVAPEIVYSSDMDIQELYKLMILNQISPGSIPTKFPLLIEAITVTVGCQILIIRFEFRDNWYSIIYSRRFLGGDISYGIEDEDISRYILMENIHTAAADDLTYMVQSPILKSFKIRIEEYDKNYQTVWPDDSFFRRFERNLNAQNVWIHTQKFSMIYFDDQVQNPAENPRILMTVWPRLFPDVLQSIKLRVWDDGHVPQNQNTNVRKLGRISESPQWLNAKKLDVYDDVYKIEISQYATLGTFEVVHIILTRDDRFAFFKGMSQKEEFSEPSSIKFFVPDEFDINYTDAEIREFHEMGVYFERRNAHTLLLRNNNYLIESCRENDKNLIIFSKPGLESRPDNQKAQSCSKRRHS